MITTHRSTRLSPWEGTSSSLFSTLSWCDVGENIVEVPTRRLLPWNDVPVVQVCSVRRQWRHSETKTCCCTVKSFFLLSCIVYRQAQEPKTVFLVSWISFLDFVEKTKNGWRSDEGNSYSYSPTVTKKVRSRLWCQSVCRTSKTSTRFLMRFIFWHRYDVISISTDFQLQLSSPSPLFPRKEIFHGTRRRKKEQIVRLSFFASTTIGFFSSPHHNFHNKTDSQLCTFQSDTFHQLFSFLNNSLVFASSSSCLYHVTIAFPFTTRWKKTSSRGTTVTKVSTSTVALVGPQHAWLPWSQWYWLW